MHSRSIREIDVATRVGLLSLSLSLFHTRTRIHRDTLSPPLSFSSFLSIFSPRLDSPFTDKCSREGLSTMHITDTMIMEMRVRVRTVVQRRVRSAVIALSRVGTSNL